jgi:glucans biosynthesis protein C
MENATEFIVREKEEANTEISTAASKSGRLAYIDVIRMVLIILVIMVHTAVTYGSAGSWTFLDTKATDLMTAALLTFFVIYCQSFFMALFFFFAGYFTPGSFDKKGILKFWKDRLIHLGIPMVLYTFFLSRIPNYMDEVANHGYPYTFWQFSLNTFLKEADEGPTWFLFALLAFSIGYTLWRLIAKRIQPFTKQIPAPNSATLIGVGIFMAAAMFVVAQFLPIIETYNVFRIFSLLLAFFPFYIVLFIGGILAYRNDWLNNLPANMLSFWKWFSLALLLSMPVLIIGGGAFEIGIDPFMSGMNWRCALMSLWFGLSCISFSITLTLWIKSIVKSGNRLATFVSPNTFTVYLIHPIILVSISFLLIRYTFHPLLKFVIAASSTIIICYALAEVLRRIPVVKEIL